MKRIGWAALVLVAALAALGRAQEKKPEPSPAALEAFSVIDKGIAEAQAEEKAGVARGDELVSWYARRVRIARLMGDKEKLKAALVANVEARKKFEAQMKERHEKGECTKGAVLQATFERAYAETELERFE